MSDRVPSCDSRVDREHEAVIVVGKVANPARTAQLVRCCKRLMLSVREIAHHEGDATVVHRVSPIKSVI